MGQCKSSPIAAQPWCEEVLNGKRHRGHSNSVEKPMSVILLTITQCSSISSASTIDSLDEEDSKSTIVSTTSMLEPISIYHYDDNESDMCAETRQARCRNVIQVHFDKTEVELVERLNL